MKNLTLSFDTPVSQSTGDSALGEPGSREDLESRPLIGTVDSKS